MRYISLFSGIEAASVAWEPLGWEPLAFCEIDEFPSAVLAHRFPDVENLGDITKVDWKEVIARHGRPDVVVGGSPCQSFSVAGGRESLSGESRLMFEYVRALDEIRPRWFLWENVPGVLNTRDNAFAQLLGEVQKLGYGSLAWRVLDAQFFGVAQRRRRVFLVGRLGEGGSAAAVLFEPESLRGDTQTSKQKREELARAAGRGSKTGCGERVASCFCGYASHTASSIGYQEEQSPTLKGNDWQSQVPDVLQAIALQTGHTKSNGLGINTEDVSYTVSTSSDQAVAFAQNTPNAEIERSMSPTLTTHAEKDASILVKPESHVLKVRQGKPGGGKGALVQTDISGTIATGNDQTILCKAETQFGEEIAGTLTARADGSPCVDRGQNVVFCRAGDAAGAETCRNMSPTLMAHCEKGAPLLVHRNETPSPARDEPHEDESHATIHDGSSWVVRRLTPIECERLQGFPDGWTDVPYKGRYHPPDGPRYKAIGNSMAVPVMRWLGERIQMVQEIMDEMEQ